MEERIAYLEARLSNLYEHVKSITDSPFNRTLYEGIHTHSKTISEQRHDVVIQGLRLEIKSVAAAVKTGLATIGAVGAVLETALTNIDAVANGLITVISDVADTRKSINQLTKNVNSIVDFEKSTRDGQLMNETAIGLAGIFSFIPEVGPLLGAAFEALWGTVEYVDTVNGDGISRTAASIHEWNQSMLMNELDMLETSKSLNNAAKTNSLLQVTLRGTRARMTSSFIAIDRMIDMYNTITKKAVFDLVPTVEVYLSKRYPGDIKTTLPEIDGMLLAFKFPANVGLVNNGRIRNAHARFVVKITTNDSSSNRVDYVKNIEMYSSIVQKDIDPDTKKYSAITLLSDDAKFDFPFDTSEKHEARICYITYPIILTFMRILNSKNLNKYRMMSLLRIVLDFSCEHGTRNAWKSIPGYDDEDHRLLLQAYHKRVKLGGFTFLGSQLLDIDEASTFFGGNDSDGIAYGTYLTNWIDPYTTILNDSDWETNIRDRSVEGENDSKYKSGQSSKDHISAFL